ncbi:MAG: 4Fe-4S binding protein [Candidatus Cloacimonetes bacterium]|nr:4Fe-4S binding protein [Candidatus Cloacimonadota bacterium]
MKVLVWDKTKCIGCGICENVCSQTWFKEENREKSRIKIITSESGLDCNVCNQCGECIDVCPVEALNRDAQGIVRLDANACVGCMSCVGFCPSASMFFAPKEPIPFKCISCGVCVKSCPTGALTLEERPEPLERVFYRRHF